MKKFISMALALVMTLSLCTFVAAPKAEADFDDADEFSSKYAVQAIDVIQTIEIMSGYDDNTFKPTAGLTRQAAAKIICNMILGPTTAKALPTNASPFPDVLPGTEWAGYISYCLQQGIISGYSDGTFKGGDPLSGYAYLKMLLGALGYDQNEEGFVGANWKVNVAKTALGIGLDKGVSVELDGTTQVTREDAAIYAFNTLQADMVEYESKNTLEINGVKVSMGGSNAVPQTWNTSSTSADNINDERSDGNNARPIVQFAERYFDKLERLPKQWDTYTADDFGRPSIKWWWKGVEIGTYSRDPDATFVGGVKVNEIYEALRENTGMSSGSSTASLYINSQYANRGYETAAGQYNGDPLKVERGNDRDLADEVRKVPGQPWSASGDADEPVAGARPTGVAGAGMRNVDRIGDGTIIEAYRNDATNHVDVCVISVYGGKVDAVKGATTKKDAYVVIKVNNGANPNKYPDTIGNNTSNREFETEDFEEDDVVAFTYSDSAAEIKSMYLMSSESGALRSKVTDKSVNLDGTVYSYGKEFTFEDLTQAQLSNKSSYIVYLDENDYVLWVEEDEFSVEDYVLIERITIETALDGVITKTASVLGTAEVNAFVGGNSTVLQRAYNQSKDAVGNSSWDAQAQVRYPSGTRRTITLDDSKNYRTDDFDDANRAAQIYTNVFAGGYTTYQPGVAVDADSYPWNGTTRISFNKDTDNNAVSDDGNWIATPFTAGHIVRVSSNSNGYRLHAIGANRFYKAENVRLAGNRLYENATDNSTALGGTRVGFEMDSETHFVIEDLAQGSYKSYVGVKNAPTVAVPVTGTHAGERATAYIYHNGGSAKLVYIVSAWEVSSSSNDIVFLVANSTSNEIEGDDGIYYEVSAVEKNEIKTLMVKKLNAAAADSGVTFRGTNFDLTTYAFTPGNDATEKEWRCVILDSVTYDSNDFITRGSWTSTDDTAIRYQGIRRVNDEEVRVNTSQANSILKDVAENVRVYFVDGDDIEQIDYSEIVNDTMDYVYVVEDKDGEVTYLFIVNYDGESNNAPAVTNYTLDTNVTGYNIVIAGSKTFTAGKTTVVPDEVLQFNVNPVAPSPVATSVTLNYTTTGGLAQTKTANLSGSVWSVVIPNDVDSTVDITFTIS